MDDDPLGLDPETMRELGYRTVDPGDAYRLDGDSFLAAVSGHRPTLESAHRILGAHDASDAKRGRPPSPPGRW